jgi:hypothetical protein
MIWSGRNLRPVDVVWRMAALFRSLAASVATDVLTVGVETGFF